MGSGGGNGRVGGRGGFDGAEQKARKLARAAVGAPDLPTHGKPVELLLGLLRETGRSADAAIVAKDFLARAASLSKSPHFDDIAVALDPTPLAIEALVDAHELDEDEARAQLDAWRGGYFENGGLSVAPHLWLPRALFVWDPTRARRLLADIPHVGPGGDLAHLFAPLRPAAAIVGTIAWLGGDRKRAVPALERAAADCRALVHPVASTRAVGYLGDALEATGDAPGACRAFATVEARWGRAAKSITATHAKARRRALGCPAP